MPAMIWLKSQASLLLQPDGIPMRVFPQRIRQTSAKRIGDHIPSYLLYLFIPAQGVIVEAALPDLFARCVAQPVDGDGGAGLEATRQ